MRHRKPRRRGDRREKGSEGSFRKCAREYCEYEPTIHKFFRQPGSACQCNKDEGLAGVLRHDFLRELKQKSSLAGREAGHFSHSGPLVHAQKPGDDQCHGPCLPNARNYQTEFIRTQVSRKGPPEDNRHQEPLKGNRRGVKREPLRSG